MVEVQEAEVCNMVFSFVGCLRFIGGRGGYHPQRRDFYNQSMPNYYPKFAVDIEMLRDMLQKQMCVLLQYRGFTNVAQ